MDAAQRSEFEALARELMQEHDIPGAADGWCSRWFHAATGSAGRGRAPVAIRTRWAHNSSSDLHWSP